MERREGMEAEVLLQKAAETLGVGGRMGPRGKGKEGMCLERWAGVAQAGRGVWWCFPGKVAEGLVSWVSSVGRSDRRPWAQAAGIPRAALRTWPAWIPDTF